MLQTNHTTSIPTSEKYNEKKGKSDMPYLYQILNTVASLNPPLGTKFIVIGFLLHHNRIVSFLVSQTKVTVKRATKFFRASSKQTNLFSFAGSTSS